MANRTVIVAQKDMPALPGPEAFLTPPLFQTLFLKPRFLTDTPVTVHLPFLFWLMTALRAERVSVLGCGDGTAYFGLCQALERNGISGRCSGFGFWPEAEPQAEPEAEPQAEPDSAPAAPADRVPAPLRAHEQMLYDSLSRLAGGETMDTALARIEAERPELLFVDLTSLPEDSFLTGDVLFTCLGARGILVLHGTHTLRHDNPRDRSLLHFLRTMPHVLLTSGQGLAVFGKGDDFPSPLHALLDSAPSGMLRSDVEQIFRSTGQGLMANAALATRTEALRKADEVAAGLRSELATTQKSLKETQASYEARSGKLAMAQSQIFDLRKETTALTRQAEDLRAGAARAETEIAALTQDRARLSEEIAALRQETATLTRARDAALAAQAADRDAHFRELAALTQDRARLSEEIAALTQARDAALAAQAADRDTYFRETTALTRLAEDLRAGTARAETEIAALTQARDAALAAQAADRDRHFRETAALTRLAEDLRAGAARAETEIAALTEDRARLSEEIAAAGQTAKDLRARLAQATATEKENAATVASLQRERDSLRSQNAELLSSTSWRVTAPMRSTKRLFSGQ